MTRLSTAESHACPPVLAPDRRREHRDQVIGNLWLIDSRNSTVMRCRCVDASRGGMRLRVPLGYGVRRGQEYELTSHLPGQSAPPGLGLAINRRAYVVRADIVQTDDDEYNVDVGVSLASVGNRTISES